MLDVAGKETEQRNEQCDDPSWNRHLKPLDENVKYSDNGAEKPFRARGNRLCQNTPVLCHPSNPSISPLNRT